MLWIYTYVHQCLKLAFLFVGFSLFSLNTSSIVSFDSLANCCVGGNLPNVSKVFLWSMMEIITSSTVLPAQIWKLFRILFLLKNTKQASEQQVTPFTSDILCNLKFLWNFCYIFRCTVSMGWYMSFQRRGAAKEKTTVFSSTLSGPICHMIWVKL